MDWFNNLKIRNKIIVSFGLIMFLMIVLSLGFIVRLSIVNESYDSAISDAIESELFMLKFGGEVRELRRVISSAVMMVNSGNDQSVMNLCNSTLGIYENALGFLNNFEKCIENSKLSKEDKDNILLSVIELRKEFNYYWNDIGIFIVECARNKDYNGCLEYINKGINSATIMSKNIEMLIGKVQLMGEREISNAQEVASETIYITVVVSIVIVVMSIVFILFMARVISRSLIPLSDFMEKAGKTGELINNERELDVLRGYSKYKDEIGKTIENCLNYIVHVSKISGYLNSIAEGNLSDKVELLSEKDTMGISLHYLLINLNKTFKEMEDSAEHMLLAANNVEAIAVDISYTADKLSYGSNSLADSSIKQINSVENVYKLLNDIENQSRSNYEVTAKAAELSDNVINKVENGNKKMDNVISAVNNIIEASNSVSRIMISINKIADNINLLSLNAGIEAARAGDYGKGFAVVADEIRKLVSESEKAVKEINNIIQNSIKQSEIGLKVAEDMYESFNDIAEDVKEKSRFVVDINKSSSSQLNSLLQVNSSMELVKKEASDNSVLAGDNSSVSIESLAIAEQSKRASEEMKIYVEKLREVIKRFKLYG